MSLAYWIFAGALMAGSSLLMPDRSVAQEQTDHSKMDHSKMDNSGRAMSGPAISALQAVNAKMHKDMDIPFTGDADVDFLKSMIPHHQGAIDMARVVLEHGKDATVKKLAEDIIKAQEAEIAMMKELLAMKATQ